LAPIKSDRRAVDQVNVPELYPTPRPGPNAKLADGGIEYAPGRGRSVTTIFHMP
jgi:hypothetical protein